MNKVILASLVVVVATHALIMIVLVEGLVNR